MSTPQPRVITLEDAFANDTAILRLLTASFEVIAADLPECDLSSINQRFKIYHLVVAPANKSVDGLFAAGSKDQITVLQYLRDHGLGSADDVKLEDHLDRLCYSYKGRQIRLTQESPHLSHSINLPTTEAHHHLMHEALSYDMRKCSLSGDQATVERMFALLQ